MTAAERDYAHTPTADRNRKKKANALAAAAANLGLQPYELAVVGGTAVHAENRTRVRRTAGLDRDPSVETWQVTIGFLIARVATMPGTYQCPRCDFYVRDVDTEHGQRIAIDPLPHPTGTVWPITTPHGQRARVLAGHDPRPDDVPLFRQHVTTCPARPKARSQAPKCLECGRPLDAQLAHRDPTYTTHPQCDPTEVR